MSAEQPHGQPKLPRPVEYGVELTREEVAGHLDEVAGIIQDVRIKYALPADATEALATGPQTISDEDNELLADCLGVLLPLHMTRVVQDEVLNGERENLKDTLFARISDLQVELLVYVSGFENSGVHLAARDEGDNPQAPTLQAHIQVPTRSLKARAAGFLRRFKL